MAAHLPLLVAGVFVVSLLYSSVGHAGASGYIAVMTLLSVAPADVKPTALALNILVASIGSWQFRRAGHFSWRLFWPFAVLSVPLAFAGGWATVPAHAFKVMTGVVLLLSATRFVVDPPEEREPSRPSRPVAAASGGVIGLLSGMTGTGGGIFLTPLMLFLGWARVKETAAVSVVFILVNSVAGLLGNAGSTRHFPPLAFALLAAAAAGGAIGSYYGSSRLAPSAIKRLLAAVLLIAGAKLVFS